VTIVVVITTSDAGEIRGAGVVSISGSVSVSGSVPSRLPRPRVSPRGKPCRFAIGEATSESYSEGTTGPWPRLGGSVAARVVLVRSSVVRMDVYIMSDVLLSK
jgi:hypothetical protein